MREISPAQNDPNCLKYLLAYPEQMGFIRKVRKEKEERKRPFPSKSLIDKSSIMTSSKRAKLLDKVASLVDENLTGRSDMCRQFALLLSLALNYLNIDAKLTQGKSQYFKGNKKIFEWEHAWVRAGKEVIDGNIDSCSENPQFPNEINIHPFWGKISETPQDRFFKKTKSTFEFRDDDVENIWWIDLKQWLDSNFIK